MSKKIKFNALIYVFDKGYFLNIIYLIEIN